MNKILIALVLAVVMSGNAYAQDLYIYCNNNWNEGYSFHKGKGFSYKYRFGTEEFVDSWVISIDWSPDYVKWNGLRVNRQTLNLERYFEGKYIFHGECSLVSDEHSLKRIIKNKRLEKTKLNKF